MGGKKRGKKDAPEKEAGKKTERGGQGSSGVEKEVSTSQAEARQGDSRSSQESRQEYYQSSSGRGRGGYEQGGSEGRGGDTQQSSFERASGDSSRRGRGGYEQGSSEIGRGGHQQGSSGRGRGGHQQGRGGHQQGRGRGDYQQGSSERGRGGHQQGSSKRGRGGYEQDSSERDRGDHQQGSSVRGRGGYEQGSSERGRGDYQRGGPGRGAREEYKQDTSEIQKVVQTVPDVPSEKVPHEVAAPSIETKQTFVQQKTSPPIKSVTESLAKTSISPFEIKERKSTGTSGRKIMVKTNHLEITFRNPSQIIYHYDVEIEPPKPFRLYWKVVEALRVKRFPKNVIPAFDGRKNIYMLEDMKNISDTVTIFDEERQKNLDYNISIKQVSNHLLKFEHLTNYISNCLNKSVRGIQTPKDVIQALDVVLRTSFANKSEFVQVGRSFFTPPKGSIIDLGDGLLLWHGFYESAIVGWKPLLNVDVTHKGFPNPVDCIQAYYDITNTNPNDYVDTRKIDLFNSYMKGLKVVYMIRGKPETKRTYKVTQLSLSAEKKIFDCNGKKISVAEYFKKEKNCALQFPHLPTLQVSKANDTCLPLELCSIVEGQVINKKLNEKQTSEMIKKSARPADERSQKILDAIKKAGFSKTPACQYFGINVSEEFEKVPARILDAPILEYRGGRSVTPRQGTWRADSFYSSINVESWHIINLSNSSDQDMNSIARNFLNFSGSVGIHLEHPSISKLTAGRIPLKNQLEDKFNELKKNNCSLVLCVIPTRGFDHKSTYSIVKQMAELHVGILTQCLKDTTIRKLNQATVVNIMLKINAKMNGLNHIISDKNIIWPKIFGKPIMVVGADVTHPSPDQTNIPSVAAVAASFDVRAFKYNFEFRVQESRLEIIQDLQDIMKNHLKNFFIRTRYKPQRILFYRDGVSEGQFDEVMKIELQAIRNACTSLEAAYKPGITFLVVQKRHHTRFFPTRREDEDGRNKNVPPGTIVDTDITHPRNFDFYLVSHASLQGTSRPTKYYCLWDDNNISEDDLEQITYYLCHLFARCTRTVSYPAPTYYAHLAAFRIRAYSGDNKFDLESFNDPRNLTKIQGELLNKNPMFFV